jgi:hypothetical protein
MDDEAEKLISFFEEEHSYKSGTGILRKLALKVGSRGPLNGTFQLTRPTKENIIAIEKFKNHLGLWFFNGVFLKDDLNVLESAQEGKTKAMRH